MASTTTEDVDDENDQTGVVAMIAVGIIGVVLTQLLVPATKAVTPRWMWVIDHCPSSEMACGSPAIGYLIPGAIASVVVIAVFWAGYKFGATE